jgi:hypothetical protein
MSLHPEEAAEFGRAVWQSDVAWTPQPKRVVRRAIETRARQEDPLEVLPAWRSWLERWQPTTWGPLDFELPVARPDRPARKGWGPAQVVADEFLTEIERQLEFTGG